MLKFSSLVLAVFIITGLWSLVVNPFYTSHDGFTHTARIAAYYQALKDGQFPPRWAQNFNSGFGSPIFVYSYPLPYLLGSFFHFTGLDYQSSFRAVMMVSFAVAGLTSFLWLKNRFGPLAGLVGAVYYLWVPYRFLNLYVRGAMAESLAYGLVPLVFLFVDRKAWKSTILSMAAVLLAHNEVAALVLPVLLGWAIMQKKLAFFVKALAGAFSLAAFIYVPDILERGFIRFDKGITYYPDHFVAFKQFFHSPWGYGFDFPGTVRDGMSFQLGLAQLAVIPGLVFVFLTKKFKKETVFFLGLLLVSLFLMLDSPLVSRVWEITPVMKTIVDFPWRFLGLTTLVFAFFAATLVFLAKNNQVLAVLLLLMVALANRNHLRINLPLSYPDAQFEEYRGTATAVSNEYLPGWRVSDRLVERPAAIEIINGRGRLAGVRSAAGEMEWLLETDEPATLRINRFYFPETAIFLDGRKLTRGRDWDIVTIANSRSYDDTGFIQVFAGPPGGSFKLEFGDTPARAAAGYLSLGTAAGIIFLAWKRKNIT